MSYTHETASNIICNLLYNLFYKTLENRVIYYRYVNKYLDHNEFITHKQIGSKSKTSKVYKCSGNTGYYAGLLKFARKTGSTRKDIRLSIKLSALVLKNINPHFNIVYRYSKGGDLICELARGDLKMFLKGYIRYEVLVNCLEQILISVLSFHIHTGLKHNDCYHGNFLYHKIAKSKPGIGYTINGLEFGIKNLGYLWMINDFDMVSEIGQDSELYLDYLDAIDAFDNYKINKKFNKLFGQVLSIVKRETNGYDMIKSLKMETELFKTSYISSEKYNQYIL